jgi:TonB-linked SusC/RagA family outer membrane protein
MKKSILIAIAAIITLTGYAQNTLNVSGKVSDSIDGSPISFANVFVKGTTVGTSTDDLGKFILENVPSDATLVFSFLGYQNLEIAVNGRAKIDVSLIANAESLDEVIMVAYGTAKKGTYTGAAAVVKQEAIKDVPSVSFEQALTGKVAGMQVSTLSGQAGSTSSIRIRGIGSMNAGNEPLYVIDGVPAISGDQGQMSGYLYTSNNAMSSLNPTDIESITVLKDAAASALYGSRAANGVIMITTKKGKQGKPQISLKAQVGFTPTFATDNYEVSDPLQQLEMEYDIFYGQYLPDPDGNIEMSQEDAATAGIKQLNKRFNKHGYFFELDGSGYDWKNVKISDYKESGRAGTFYDWESQLLRTAVYQTYDLSVSGATDITNYYTSLAYTKQQGRNVTNDFDRISGRVNLNQKIGKYVEFSTNINLSRSKKTGFNDSRSTGSNYFLQSRNLLWGVYWPTDYKTGEPWTSRYGSYAYNSLYYDNEWDNSSVNLKINAVESLTVHIIKGLDAKTTFSYDNSNTKDHIYFSANHFIGSEDNGSVTEMTTNVNKVVSSTTVNYNNTFAQKHTLGVLVGFEAEKNFSEFQRSSGTNLPTSSLHTVSTAGKLDASGYSWGSSMMSILSRLEYNYDSRYYLSGSFRRDGSSKLGPQTRWGNFWSAAGSWKINNEGFMKDISWINNLRIRGSYGVNGTLPSALYGWRSLTSYYSKYMNEPGGGVSSISTADLAWETNYTWNIALEFGFFDNRLYGTIEYYNRDSKDLLQYVPISTVTGFSSTLKNIGQINNHGVEVEIGGDIIRTKEWNWNMSLNFSKFKSTVTKLSDGADILWTDPTGGDGRADFIYREGESTLALYGYEWAGVNPENGYNIWYSNNDNSDYQLNGRNVVYDYDDADYKIIADLNPKFYGGLNTSVSWKGLSLDLGFTYRIGGYTYDGAEKDVADDGYYWERTRSKEYYNNRWTVTNKDGKYPRLLATDPTDAMQCSSRHLKPADYLRLKNITLAYSLPKNVIRKINLSNVRFFFNGSNLLTFAAYKGYDPEVSEYGTRGWEMPLGKTYTFGVELTF